MYNVIIDCDSLKNQERTMLEQALSKAVVTDMPLVLELLFVSAEEIQELNARVRGIDKVTDVLSFPAMELACGEAISAEEHGECVEEGRLYLGSVVICKERAKEQAQEYGHSVAREIGYLTVHGFLHCLGYDHEIEKERKVMREKEEEIMQRLGLGRSE
ncbi:MAG: rRNA maturation RNase YbeY [Clostridia bacterium]|nr:rRNA maturation RNase YbeY [Clostridia bacterium]